MKIIAHRANIYGPIPSIENKPKQIDICINQGYEVEIDVRFDPKTEIFWLGHDKPEYSVNWAWLEKRAKNIWIHCKDINSLNVLSQNSSNYHYFWHQNDDYTLTSKKFIWTYPGKSYTEKSIIVMPEWEKIDWNILKKTNCYGICTDYPSKLK